VGLPHSLIEEKKSVSTSFATVMGEIWWGTRGKVPPTFSGGGDMTYHVPPTFFSYLERIQK